MVSARSYLAAIVAFLDDKKTPAFAGVFYKVQSSEFKVHPSPLVLRRDKNFARCAQHNINWIATRRYACSQ